MTKLSVDTLCEQARRFSEEESLHFEPTLFGVTDGKAVGTYIEHKFRDYLKLAKHDFIEGSSANGIDFPDLKVDLKVTSKRQPQSSCPFKSARQKIYGLGYSLIVFVYDKVDDEVKRTSTLNITATIFIEEHRTADYQLTKGLLSILENEGNEDDLIAFMTDKNLPADEIGLKALAEEILNTPPQQGYLTISNALQWRLQYSRVIEKAGSIEGIRSVHRGQV